MIPKERSIGEHRIQGDVSIAPEDVRVAVIAADLVGDVAVVVVMVVGSEGLVTIQPPSPSQARGIVLGDQVVREMVDRTALLAQDG